MKEYFLWDCSHVNDTEHLWWLVKIELDNGLEAIRKQAVMSHNVDSDLCHYMASLADNDYRGMNNCFVDFLDFKISTITIKSLI